jgi:hypothetical protein
LSSLKKKEHKDDEDKKNFHNCDIDIWHRFLTLFIFILIPTFLMIYLGAFFSIRKYEKRIKKPLVPESNYNKNSLIILKRAENFMIFKTFWTMIGMTIWSLRNIFSLF